MEQSIVHLQSIQPNTMNLVFQYLSIQELQLFKLISKYLEFCITKHYILFRPPTKLEKFVIDNWIYGICILNEGITPAEKVHKITDLKRKFRGLEEVELTISTLQSQSAILDLYLQIVKDLRLKLRIRYLGRDNDIIPTLVQNLQIKQITTNIEISFISAHAALTDMQLLLPYITYLRMSTKSNLDLSYLSSGNHLKSLTLGHPFTDMNIDYLIKLLREAENLEKLNISLWGINENQGVELQKIFRENNSVQQLKIGYKGKDKQLKYLFAGIKKNKVINDLGIEFSFNFTQEINKSVIEGLMKMLVQNKNITKLLINNYIGSQNNSFIIPLFKHIKSGEISTEILTLILPRAETMYKEFSPFSNLYKLKINLYELNHSIPKRYFLECRLTKLNLSKSILKSETWVILFDLLDSSTPYLASLKKLTIEGTKDIRALVPKLFKSLQTNTHLEAFTFRRVRLERDSFYCILDYIRNNTGKLTKLNISQLEYAFTDIEIIALFTDLITQNKSIKIIKFKDNRSALIFDEELFKIMQIVPNPILQFIDFRKNYFIDLEYEKTLYKNIIHWNKSEIHSKKIEFGLISKNELGEIEVEKIL